MRRRNWNSAEILCVLFAVLVMVFAGPDVQCRRISEVPIPPVRILFDDAHGQSFGNADWTPHHAYSDFAQDLRDIFDASVFGLGLYGDGTLTPDILDAIDLLILPEPNIRYSKTEMDAIRRFVSKGGGLLLIADHGGSDRNFDGWDSCMIFNELTRGWDITFLGDTFSETPVRGRRAFNSYLLKDLRGIGAWAATSILIEPDTWHWFPVIESEETGYPFIVKGEIGAGRVVAIGDSSAFDDGTGDTSKNRHSAYHSWIFNQRGLAMRTAAWLLNRRPLMLPASTPPYPVCREREPGLESQAESRAESRAEAKPDSAVSRIVIDASLGNNDADLLERFVADITGDSRENSPMTVCVNMDNYDNLHPGDILLLTNPGRPFPEDAAAQLADWVRSGGRLILTGASARNPLSKIPDINRLLSQLGSGMRLNADQIQDPVSNSGKPWSVKAVRFADRPEFRRVDSAIFWGCASVVDTEGRRLRDSEDADHRVTVLAWTSPHAVSEVKSFFSVSGGKALPETPVRELSETQAETSGGPSAVHRGGTAVDSAIPVAAMERLGRGIVVLMGADPFTEYQYPTDWEKQNLERIKWDHRTPEFNRGVLQLLETIHNEQSETEAALNEQSETEAVRNEQMQTGALPSQTDQTENTYKRETDLIKTKENHGLSVETTAAGKDTPKP